ncbi:hypothetical protein [Fodinicurvata halophila]|uniref:hypothetical protein n=1 Tax=Fodinicurvata halophila TaxID=1419723 RepID=UPI00362C5B24
MTDQHDSESGQEEIIAFLKDPSTHPEAAGEVRHVTTHVAHVFLAGERAWKIKRAVAYSFLDFTGLEAREEVCRREVELNRRTAPQIYLGVHAITRARDGGLEFDGAGETLDWVIEMRRFDQALMFDHLIEQGSWSRATSSTWWIASMTCMCRPSASPRPTAGPRACKAWWRKMPRT